MAQNDGRNTVWTVERSLCLVGLGWIVLAVLYCGQVCLFISFLVKHLDNWSYVAWFLLFVPAVLYTFYAFFDKTTKKFKYAENDVKIWDVWFTWGLYIVAYIITVGVIFGKVVHKLTKDDDLGINTLLSTLCIAPALLILLLQLAICPGYRKPVLSLSIFTALNIFDGIEMLEIFLMQKKEDFDLGTHMEKSIVVFACFGFLLTPFGLLRNKFRCDGEVRERQKTSMFLGPLEIIGTNLPFLVLRAIIWRKNESAVFMAKNAIALVVGGVEFVILKGWCKCEGKPTQTLQIV